MSTIVDQTKILIQKCIDKDDYEQNNLKIYKILKIMSADEMKQLFDWAENNFEAQSSGYHATILGNLSKMYGDQVLAKAWYLKAAFTDDPTGMVCFGKILEDHDESIKWIERAANMGSILAYYELGMISYCNDDNHKHCMEYFLKAAEKGFPKAMLQIAYIYMDGLTPFKKDYSEARKWLLLADSNGSEDALELIAINYGAERNYTEAFKYYTKAIDSDKNYNIEEKNDYLSNRGQLQTNWLDIGKYLIAADDKIKKLEAEIETLKIEIIYRPGGSGYIESKDHFELASSSSVPAAKFVDKPSLSKKKSSGIISGSIVSTKSCFQSNINSFI
ncbi:MAG: sel1 repeat family protein [Hyperionvirus sp.]|uniref:Sel1 repeat family protein n=1 Tax=Hyperionvirus sp. TaxID=2487770 RepID=A0A3G5AA46_9VIRU|nr:MAG: sel1 repeat family protein [Hyperionvirus sp.]